MKGTTRRSGKRIAIGVGALAVILISALLLVPSFREWLREEWYLHGLDSADPERRVESTAKLLQMRSPRGWARMMRYPQPENALLFTRDPILALRDLDPDALDLALRQALAEGELTEAEITRACNLAIPSWRQAMERLGLEHPPKDLRSLDQLPHLIDALRRLAAAVRRK